MNGTYLMFWLSVPIAWIGAFWIRDRPPFRLPVAAILFGWALYGLFIALLRQIANTTNADWLLVAGLVLPSILVVLAGVWPLGVWTLDRAMAKRRVRSAASTGSADAAAPTDSTGAAAPAAPGAPAAPTAQAASSATDATTADTPTAEETATAGSWGSRITESPDPVPDTSAKRTQETPTSGNSAPSREDSAIPPTPPTPPNPPDAPLR